MKDRPHHVCPAGHAWSLDNRLRRWLQDPRRILAPYVREGMTALDLGCGPGFFTLEMAHLAGPTGHVIACDLQAGMLRRLERKIRGTELAARITLHACGKDRLGLDRKFDFALAFYVVHEVPDPDRLFGELALLLAPGGRALVVEPPLHVSRRAFENSLRAAQAAGLAPTERPPIRFGRAVVLEPADPRSSTAGGGLH